jgi:hypothetical protein
VTGLESRAHVPVIPTVARPKNIMGSRPYSPLGEKLMAGRGRTKYHDGRCEVDGLGREVCNGSLEPDQSCRNGCNLGNIQRSAL